MSQIHALSFPDERGWTTDEFATLLSPAHVFAVSEPEGFAVIRDVAGEAELLTLAVHPDHRRQGIADRLMTRWMHACAATEAFLEVAADNHPAITLYTRHRFAEAGRRKAYYARHGRPAADALLMRAALTPRKMA